MQFEKYVGQWAVAAADVQDTGICRTAEELALPERADRVGVAASEGGTKGV